MMLEDAEDDAVSVASFATGRSEHDSDDEGGFPVFVNQGRESWHSAPCSAKEQAGAQLPPAAIDTRSQHASTQLPRVELQNYESDAAPGSHQHNNARVAASLAEEPAEDLRSLRGSRETHKSSDENKDANREEHQTKSPPSSETSPILNKRKDDEHGRTRNTTSASRVYFGESNSDCILDDKPNATSTACTAEKEYARTSGHETQDENEAERPATFTEGKDKQDFRVEREEDDDDASWTEVVNFKKNKKKRTAVGENVVEQPQQQNEGNKEEEDKIDARFLNWRKEREEICSNEAKNLHVKDKAALLSKAKKRDNWIVEDDADSARSTGGPHFATNFASLASSHLHHDWADEELGADDDALIHPDDLKKMQEEQGAESQKDGDRDEHADYNKTGTTAGDESSSWRASTSSAATTSRAERERERKRRNKEKKWAKWYGYEEADDSYYHDSYSSKKNKSSSAAGTSTSLSTSWDKYQKKSSKYSRNKWDDDHARDEDNFHNRDGREGRNKYKDSTSGYYKKDKYDWSSKDDYDRDNHRKNSKESRKESKRRDAEEFDASARPRRVPFGTTSSKRGEQEDRDSDTHFSASSKTRTANTEHGWLFDFSITDAIKARNARARKERQMEIDDKNEDNKEHGDDCGDDEIAASTSCNKDRFSQDEDLDQLSPDVKTTAMNSSLASTGTPPSSSHPTPQLGDEDCGPSCDTDEKGKKQKESNCSHVDAKVLFGTSKEINRATEHADTSSLAKNYDHVSTSTRNPTRQTHDLEAAAYLSHLQQLHAASAGNMPPVVAGTTAQTYWPSAASGIAQQHVGAATTYGGDNMMSHLVHDPHQHSHAYNQAGHQHLLSEHQGFVDGGGGHLHHNQQAATHAANQHHSNFDELQQQHIVHGFGTSSGQHGARLPVLPAGPNPLVEENVIAEFSDWRVVRIPGSTRPAFIYRDTGEITEQVPPELANLDVDLEVLQRLVPSYAHQGSGSASAAESCNRQLMLQNLYPTGVQLRVLESLCSALNLPNETEDAIRSQASRAMVYNRIAYLKNVFFDRFQCYPQFPLATAQLPAAAAPFANYAAAAAAAALTQSGGVPGVGACFGGPASAAAAQLQPHQFAATANALSLVNSTLAASAGLHELGAGVAAGKHLHQQGLHAQVRY
ncbi:unnamed protein product [Amoebophrya sp. A120]|nr:unnamed protein product [Amoebophrya sp. A120]|eukprot:GSA120T00004236001.1